MTIPKYHSLLWLGNHSAATYPVETTLEVLPACLYKPVFSERGALIMLSIVALCNVNREIAHIALQTIRDKSKDSLVSTQTLDQFYIDPNKMLPLSLKELTGYLKTVREETGPLISNLKELGWTYKTLLTLIPKIEKISKEIFNNLQKCVKSKNPYIFHTKQSKESISTWKNTVGINCSEYIYAHFGCAVYKDLHLSDEVIKQLRWYSGSHIEISCFEYALAKTDVKTAYSYLFDRYPPKARLEWCFSINGWESVSHPVEGGLVLYYDQCTKKIVHAAIYKGNGKAVSKPGNLFPGLIEHNLFDLCALYGSAIFFMRITPC